MEIALTEESVRQLQQKISSINVKELNLRVEELNNLAVAYFSKLFEEYPTTEIEDSYVLTMPSDNCRILLTLSDMMKVKTLTWYKKPLGYDELNGLELEGNWFADADGVPYRYRSQLNRSPYFFRLGEFIPIVQCMFFIFLYDFLKNPNKEVLFDFDKVSWSFQKQYDETIDNCNCDCFYDIDSSSLIGKTIRETMWLPGDEESEKIIHIHKIEYADGRRLKYDDGREDWYLSSDIEDLIKNGSVTNAMEIPYSKLEIL